MKGGGLLAAALTKPDLRAKTKYASYPGTRGIAAGHAVTQSWTCDDHHQRAWRALERDGGFVGHAARLRPAEGDRGGGQPHAHASIDRSKRRVRAAIAEPQVRRTDAGRGHERGARSRQVLSV